MAASMNSRISRQVLGVIVFVTAIRCILSLQLELTSVESYLWVCSQRPAAGYFDYPGMIAWMGWVSTALFGHSPLGVRMVTILCSGGMIGFAYLTARRLYDEQVGRLAAFLVALVPILFAFAAEATPDGPCIFFWSATAWALAHALSGDSPRWWYPAGLFLGFAMDSKYHAVFLGFGIFGFLLLSPDHRSWLKRKEPWIGVVLSLVAFSPTLLWNAQNGWQSFAYQGVSRFKESGFQPSQLYKFPFSQLALLTPALCLWAWGGGIATLLRWRRADWRDRFLTALGTPLLIFFFLVIVSRPVRGHWTAPGYVTPLILSAAVVLRGREGVRQAHWGSLGVLAFGYLISPILVLLLIPVEHRRGWAFLAGKVAARKADFVVCNEYHLASQMGYLLRTREAWELTPVGKPSKNFPNWWRAEEHLGKNAVIVYDGKHFPAEMERIRACFDRVDEPEEIVVPRVRIAGQGDNEKYYVMSAWNYKGAPKTDPRAAPSDD
jgi:4-amino-4-deoxy-L-arabinose transferase-like glycosyltransferase